MESDGWRKRPHSQRFCDVAVTVKFYCKCDVAKSFRMRPTEMIFNTQERLRYLAVAVTASARYIPEIHRRLRHGSDGKMRAAAAASPYLLQSIARTVLVH